MQSGCRNNAPKWHHFATEWHKSHFDAIQGILMVFINVNSHFMLSRISQSIIFCLDSLAYYSLRNIVCYCISPVEEAQEKSKIFCRNISHTKQAETRLARLSEAASLLPRKPRNCVAFVGLRATETCSSSGFAIQKSSLLLLRARSSLLLLRTRKWTFFCCFFGSSSYFAFTRE